MRELGRAGRPEVMVAAELVESKLAWSYGLEIKTLSRQGDYNALRVAASRICEALGLSQTCGIATLDQADGVSWNDEIPSPAVLAQRLIMSKSVR